MKEMLNTTVPMNMGIVDKIIDRFAKIFYNLGMPKKPSKKPKPIGRIVIRNGRAVYLISPTIYSRRPRQPLHYSNY